MFACAYVPVSSEEIGVACGLPPDGCVDAVARDPPTILLQGLRVTWQHICLAEHPVLISYEGAGEESRGEEWKGEEGNGEKSRGGERRREGDFKTLTSKFPYVCDANDSIPV